MWKMESLGNMNVFDDVEQVSTDKSALIAQQISVH